MKHKKFGAQARSSITKRIAATWRELARAGASTAVPAMLVTTGSDMLPLLLSLAVALHMWLIWYVALRDAQ